MFILASPPAAVPASAFGRAFDSLFDAAEPAVRAPAMDIAESDSAYTVTMNVPGATKEQVKVSVEGRHVSVEAELASQAERKDGERILYRERSAQRFARRFSVPAEVDQAGSQAKLDNGVLTLTLPKKAASARQITIN